MMSAMDPVASVSIARGEHMTEETNSRRRFMKWGATAAGALVAANPIGRALAESRRSVQACGLTPAQTAGPFYPGESQFHTDNDLTQVPGASQRALGQVIYIRGQVIDTACRPIAGANVEIWQACASGRYNNPKDPNPAPLDPHFKYWGETHTDEQGRYEFKTIIPGAYPADVGWDRPPHIHVKVARLGYRELISQMYFAGEALNESDLILREVPAGDRSRVIVEFRPVGPELEPGALIGEFDLCLRRVRESRE